jgi:hypothetical protein
VACGSVPMSVMIPVYLLVTYTKGALTHISGQCHNGGRSCTV